MAFGLPGVSFDLISLREYYPSGMVKVPCFSTNQFADEVVRLLTDSEYYLRYAGDARTLIEQNWTWNYRMHSAFQSIDIQLERERSV